MELSDIYAPVKGEIILVKEEIRRQLEQIVEAQHPKDRRFMRDLVSYLFDTPGKMLRPALVLLSAKSIDGNRIVNMDQAVQLAAAVEFVHSASLIHDDIIDDSECRRNRLSLNRKFGNKIAVLAGDIFYSQFFAILIGLEPGNAGVKRKMLLSFSETTRNLCFGEIFEHKIRINGDDSSFNEYLQVVKNKTACLFAAACMNGALLSGADNRVTAALYNYGLSLGYAFQIVDDVVDRDAIYYFSESIFRRAREYADSARDVVDILPESRTREVLEEIPRFLLAQVEVYHPRAGAQG